MPPLFRARQIVERGFLAAVVVRTGSRLTPDELLHAGAPGLPLDRVLVGETIPVTEQGKPDRLALAELFACRRSRPTVGGIAGRVGDGESPWACGTASGQPVVRAEARQRERAPLRSP
jgi:hypothetical protein